MDSVALVLFWWNVLLYYLTHYTDKFVRALSRRIVSQSTNKKRSNQCIEKKGSKSSTEKRNSLQNNSEKVRCLRIYFNSKNEKHRNEWMLNIEKCSRKWTSKPVTYLNKRNRISRAFGKWQQRMLLLKGKSTSNECLTTNCSLWQRIHFAAASFYQNVYEKLHSKEWSSLFPICENQN